MTRLVVRLLGGFRVEVDGEAVYSFETDKARALFAYLIVEVDRPHRREALASLLWPERPDTIARANLRQALVRVRRALGDLVSPGDGAIPPPNHGGTGRSPPLLFVTLTDVQFNAASDYSLDVAALEAFARPSAGGPGRRLQPLPEALCADFLAGFAVPDSETFQAWVLNKQEYYHRLALDILEDQNAAFEAAGDFERAVAAARLQLRMEPWLEEAHRRCMRGLALAGRRDEALHQYELCRLALEAELGAEPAPSTETLSAAIRAGQLPPTPHPPRISSRARDAGRDSPPGAPPVWPHLSLQDRPPTALVAREDELGQLGRYLEAALAGETGVAFVSGDAGSGKTVLLEAFAALAMTGHPDLLVAGARCSPGGSLDPFAPLRRLADTLFGDLDGETAWPLHGRTEAGRLQDATTLVLSALARQGAGLVEMLVPAASLARRAGQSTPLAASSRQPGWLPRSQGALSQGALFDQLMRTLAAISREQPLLLLFDDLHWVDDASAAFLAHLGRELSRSRLLVLGAYRTSTVSLGRRDARSGELTRHPLAAVVNELRREKGDIVIELDRADGRAFVEAYVDTQPNRLGAPFRDALYAQTGGHALFTVESLRNLQDRGELFKDEADRWVARESLDWGELPARVEAAIAERIERLPENSRRFLSAASVQGDDFTGELVAELTGEPVGEVIAALSGSLARQHHLVRSEGLQQVGSDPRSVYRFRHHLFQKYLYDALDRIERARWHAAVASSLARQVGEDPAARERFGARLAWHYESAGLPEQAARALLDAGRQATRVSAFREALSLFDHGLALLRSTHATGPAASAAAERALAERARVEQLLQIARMVPQRVLRGSVVAEFGSAPVQVSETAAGELDDRTRLATLVAEAGRLIVLGQFAQILDIAERMLDLATRCGDDTFEAMARFLFGLTYHSLGEPIKADGYFEWVLARHTPGRWAELRVLAGFDLLSHALTFSAINNLALGRLDEALARSARAVTAAQDLGDHAGLASASAVGSLALFLLRSDPRSLQERAELCFRHCEKHGFAWWQYYAAALLGWLTVVRGEPDEGIERVQRAFAAWQATGMLLGSDGLGILLADACLEAVRKQRQGKDRVADSPRAGLLTEGLARIDAMLAPDSLCGQCYQAELYRMRGELLLARDGLAAAGDALDCFRRALALGLEKGALAWQLRAAMSVLRLRERQGAACAAELVEARAYLRGVYARFTEGFSFPDLAEAAALMGDASCERIS